VSLIRPRDVEPKAGNCLEVLIERVELVVSFQGVGGDYGIGEGIVAPRSSG